MTDIGQFILAVVKHTPLWTWVLLAYLILQGLRAMRGGSTSLLRLSIIPVAFAVWGLWGVFNRFQGSGLSIAVWIISFTLGIGFGMLRTMPLTVHVNSKNQTVELPGSPLALVSTLLVFAIKYVMAVLSAIRPDTLTAFWFLFVDVGITGLVAGLFAGRLFSLWQKYRVAMLNNAATA